jgi:PleD family two-component response regulator
VPLAATRRPPYPPDTLADRRPRLAVLVSDHGWSARVLEAVLVTEGYATLRAQSADQAMALCAAADPDLIFVERSLSGCTPPTPRRRQGAGRKDEPGGLALCRRLRQEGAVSDAAPVVITTTDTLLRSDLLDALGAGAWDLCALPTDSTALLARCAVWVRAKRHADRTAELGLCDHETGFYNLRGLVRRARELASASRRGPTTNAPLTCVAFRAEWQGGRGAPRDVVRRIGDACREVGRATDSYARTGPRDFAVLAPGTTVAGGQAILERLRGALHGGGLACRGVVRVADGALDGREEAAELVLGAVGALPRGD